ncbi:hypothetical protein SeLEV6574_g03859 [Synchytrium endobioticum]|uniref:Uncharacterized protein n=1 Tax=Synchytrium endobioticum TaxID=286115 RepID=A0A507D1X0_9FUNG|nr:hypothetical protein SeLEV6574_g03859 [Synchytrium endobioticum]
MNRQALKNAYPPPIAKKRQLLRSQQRRHRKHFNKYGKEDTGQREIINKTKKEISEEIYDFHATQPGFHKLREQLENLPNNEVSRIMANIQRSRTTEPCSPLPTDPQATKSPAMHLHQHFSPPATFRPKHTETMTSTTEQRLQLLHFVNGKNINRILRGGICSLQGLTNIAPKCSLIGLLEVERRIFEKTEITDSVSFSSKGQTARLLNQTLTEGTKMALGGARNTNQRPMLTLAGVRDAECMIKKSKFSIKKQLTQSAEEKSTLASALIQDHTKWPTGLLTGIINSNDAIPHSRTHSILKRTALSPLTQKRAIRYLLAQFPPVNTKCTKCNEWLNHRHHLTCPGLTMPTIPQYTPKLPFTYASLNKLKTSTATELDLALWAGPLTNTSFAKTIDEIFSGIAELIPGNRPT